MHKEKSLFQRVFISKINLFSYLQPAFSPIWNLVSYLLLSVLLKLPLERT